MSKKKHTNLGLPYVANQLDLQDTPQYAAIVKKAHKLLKKARKAMQLGQGMSMADFCGAGPRECTVYTEKQYEEHTAALREIDLFLETDTPV